MWRSFSLIILLIACFICGLPSPSNCNIIRPDKIQWSHATKVVAMKNVTKVESSIDRISELGRLLTVCPFRLKKNQMKNRIPSTFYEMECVQCNRCGKNGAKCTQLLTEMEAVFLEVDDSTWTETLIVKAGCTCSPVSGRTSANIRP